MSASNFDVTKLFEGKLALKGTDVPASSLAGKVVAVYFSAHWCPPCRAFTPTLIKAYQAAKEQGLPFELIFVSSDEDQEGFDEYTADMPFPSVKFEVSGWRRRGSRGRHGQRAGSGRGRGGRGSALAHPSHHHLLFACFFLSLCVFGLIQEEDARSQLGEQFSVRGIPSLQVIGKDGKMITTDGRTGISKDKEAAIKAWCEL